MLTFALIAALSAPPQDTAAQAREQLQQRVACQLVAKKFTETAVFLAPPAISEDVIAAHAVADFMASGGDWPKGTRAFIQSLNITPEQLSPFELTLRSQIDQHAELDLAVYFRNCQQAHGEPVTPTDDEDY